MPVVQHIAPLFPTCRAGCQWSGLGSRESCSDCCGIGYASRCLRVRIRTCLHLCIRYLPMLCVYACVWVGRYLCQSVSVWWVCRKSESFCGEGSSQTVCLGISYLPSGWSWVRSRSVSVCPISMYVLNLLQAVLVGSCSAVSVSGTLVSLSMNML